MTTTATTAEDGLLQPNPWIDVAPPELSYFLMNLGSNATMHALPACTMERIMKTPSSPVLRPRAQPYFSAEMECDEEEQDGEATTWTMIDDDHSDDSSPASMPVPHPVFTPEMTSGVSTILPAVGVNTRTNRGVKAVEEEDGAVAVSAAAKDGVKRKRNAKKDKKALSSAPSTSTNAKKAPRRTMMDIMNAMVDGESGEVEVAEVVEEDQVMLTEDEEAAIPSGVPPAVMPRTGPAHHPPATVYLSQDPEAWRAYRARCEVAKKEQMARDLAMDEAKYRFEDSRRQFIRTHYVKRGIPVPGDFPKATCSRRLKSFKKDGDNALFKVSDEKTGWHHRPSGEIFLRELSKPIPYGVSVPEPKLKRKSDGGGSAPRCKRVVAFVPLEWVAELDADDRHAAEEKKHRKELRASAGALASSQPQPQPQPHVMAPTPDSCIMPLFPFVYGRPRPAAPTAESPLVSLPWSVLKSSMGVTCFDKFKKKKSDASIWNVGFTLDGCVGDSFLGSGYVTSFAHHCILSSTLQRMGQVLTNCPQLFDQQQQGLLLSGTPATSSSPPPPPPTTPPTIATTPEVVASTSPPPPPSPAPRMERIASMRVLVEETQISSVSDVDEDRDEIESVEVGISPILLQERDQDVIMDVEQLEIAAQVEELMRHSSPMVSPLRPSPPIMDIPALIVTNAPTPTLTSAAATTAAIHPVVRMFQEPYVDEITGIWHSGDLTDEEMYEYMRQNRRLGRLNHPDFKPDLDFQMTCMGLEMPDGEEREEGGDDDE